MPKKKYYLEITSPLGKAIHTTKIYWDYISKMKHPEVKDQKRRAVATIENPDIIKRSIVDPEIFGYYLKFNDKHFCMVTRHLNGEGFIITAYITRKFIEGEIVYQKET